LLAQWKYHPRD